ncbi:hypothetical protein OKS35_08520 [Exiguobacterium sp. N5]|uniref:hypothetical protein n=1 Tax=Exiguobacterium sp. N5 TaxID=2990450 RepID=UPI0021F49383|nr:hypothetical protein [Exiguobacterium sp. N5]MCV9900170.1 hypothetical protein [Exiguobacterium sp. N5]
MGQRNFLWLGAVVGFSALVFSALVVWLLQDALPFWALSILLLGLGAVLGNLQRRFTRDE